MLNSTIKNITTVFPIDRSALQAPARYNQHRDIIKEFSLNTSTHGIPGIARSKSMHNRMFWLISFLAFLGIMCYFIIQAVLAYFQYPTLTLIGFADIWPQTFAAVTICNNSPLRYDQFIGPFLNYTNALNLTNTNDITTFTEEQASYIMDYMQYILNRNESLNQFYYPLSSMLIKCTYNGMNCSANDFVQFASPVYGSCYTFNAQSPRINNNSIHYNNENGYSGELHLDLYIHSQQYVPHLSEAISLVAMVHDNTQLPRVEAFGIQLAPGRKHRLGYYKRQNTFLPSPYTTCADQITPRLQTFYDQFSEANYGYSQQLCYDVAIQAYTYQQCGCVNPFQWGSRYVIPFGSTTTVYASLCNVSDPCYAEAISAFQSFASIYEKYAPDCGLECSSTQFVLKISSGLAPPPWSMNSIKQFVESTSIPLTSTWNETWKEEIRGNFVSVDIICESTTVESYTQQATLGAVDVISNIGGQTGLWIGISFLSLMEVAEMIYRLLRHQCTLIQRKPSGTQKQHNTRL
ncbi:unnamed protein product [Adineta ricciae]|uniref:Uncharacterized protein n=1 Tax=Adineta ricciae TaxID=249248 RepID=A0A815CM98_ADIRI|nr:unnamed protein product [Adineta ricciae]CAF1282191.1 unnamed protein product [Adineta ricciae]